MSLIVEYETEPRRASVALAAMPGTTLDHDEIHLTPDGDVRWFFRARGAGPEFDAALAADPTIECYRVLDDRREGRRYAATLAGPPGRSVVPAFRHLDVQILGATHEAEQTVVRVRCPSRTAFTSVRRVVAATNESFVARRIYREGEEEAGGRQFNMTPAQHEALTTALDAGYYEVPRDATLQDVAGRLDISDSAASARLRRGVAGLLRWSLTDPGDP
jgi:hypothetical protein